MEETDSVFRNLLTADLIRSIVALIPEEWLVTGSPFATAVEHRQAYCTFLQERIAHSEMFITQVQDAKKGSL